MAIWQGEPIKPKEPDALDSALIWLEYQFSLDGELYRKADLHPSLFIQLRDSVKHLGPCVCPNSDEVRINGSTFTHSEDGMLTF